MLDGPWDWINGEDAVYVTLVSGRIVEVRQAQAHVTLATGALMAICGTTEGGNLRAIPGDQVMMVDRVQHGRR